MSQSTPIEIWHKILRYSISVPLFFDANPAKTCGIEQIAHYYRESDYWTSERQRNRLRRVCSSWDDFLSGYAHRYVYLVDVWHNYIPSGVISAAIRLKIQPDIDCRCQKCEQLPVNELEDWMGFLLRQCLTSGPEIWRVEILDGHSNLDMFYYTSLKDRVPHLRSVIGAVARSLETFGRGEGLETIVMDEDIEDDLDSFLTPATLNLHYLTTLHMHTKSLEVDISPEWELPSLRHFSINYNAQATERNNLYLEKILRRLGGSLKTFHFADLDLQTSIETDVWSLMPMVEQIQLPRWEHLPPPSWHPLRVVQISMRAHNLVIGGIFLTDVLRGSHYLPYWINERTLGFLSNERQMQVQIDVPWLLFLFGGRFEPKTIGSVLHLDNMCAVYGIRFTDPDGITLMDYILFAVQAYWKKGCARRHLHLRDYSMVLPF